MAFRNPILAGVDLIRAAIQSPNYEPGKAGWRISRDGLAEFLSAVIRGEFITEHPSGSRIEIRATETGGVSIEIKPEAAIGELVPAEISIHGNLLPGGKTQRYISFTSPRPPGGNSSYMYLMSQDDSPDTICVIAAREIRLVTNVLRAWAGALDIVTDQPDDSSYITRDGKSLLPRVQAYRLDTSASTNTATFSNIGSPVSFIKQYSDTHLVVELSGSAFCTSAVSRVLVAVGVTATGISGDAPITEHVFNQLSTHMALPVGYVQLSNLPAGTVTLQPKWRRVSGTGTILMDETDDVLFLKVSEVQPI